MTIKLRQSNGEELVLRPSDYIDTDRASAILGYPAQIIERATMGLSDETLMQLARGRAYDPTVFDEEDSAPFFWFAQISNNQLDAYCSRMMKSSLLNYAAGADSGVAFQNSHNCRELPMGGSLKGRYVGPGGNGAARVEAAFFTVRNLQQGAINTSELIRGIRTGVTRDVSIGFYGGRSVCSVCGADMWDYRACPHWPGEVVNMTDAQGKVTGTRVAEELIEDANLAEVSAVYDGACPGAAIQKAMRALEAGVLEPKQARILEARYRINISGAEQTWRGIGPGERAMTTAANPAPAETQTPVTAPAGERATDPGTTAPPAAQPPATAATPPAAQPPAVIHTARAGEPTSVTEILTSLRVLNLDTSAFDRVQAEFARMHAEIVRLSPLADAGKKYRESLIEEALTQGKRANGAGFAEETQRALLAGATIEQIVAIRDGFKATGDERFPGGRSTTDTVTPAPSEPANTIPSRTNATQVEIKPPDAAFRTM